MDLTLPSHHLHQLRSRGSEVVKVDSRGRAGVKCAAVKETLSVVEVRKQPRVCPTGMSTNTRRLVEATHQSAVGVVRVWRKT